MAGAIFGWTFAGAWLVVPLWTFFDAEERGRNGILWAVITSLFFPFFPVGLVVYAIMLGRDEGSGLSPGARGRQYLFTAAFFFLLVAYGTLVGLLVVALDAAWSDNPLDGDDARVTTAVLLAILVFALPLWAFHWVRAQALLDEAHDTAQQRALFVLERGYGGAVILIGTLITVGFGVFLVFTLFAAIMDVFQGGSEQFIPVVAFLPLTVIVVAYHWTAIFRSKKYQELAGVAASVAAPAPTPSPPSVQPQSPAPTAPPGVQPTSPVPPPTPTSGRRFCGQCGAENAPENRFCSACGAQLQTTTP